MRLLPAILLLLPLSALAQTQVPNVFEDGKPAKAAEVNENFQYVMENASGGGGCSATQQDNSVLIECADGTSGVIAGAGSVLVLPEGEVGETPDYSVVNVGDFYWVDGDGIFLGKRWGGSESDVQQIYTDYCPSACSNQVGFFMITLAPDHNAKQMVIYPGFFQVLYTEPDCAGLPLITGNLAREVFMLDGDYAVWKDERLPAETLLYSVKQTAHGHPNSGWIDQSECENFSEPTPGNGYFIAPYTPAPEILNAAYPVRLEQLP